MQNHQDYYELLGLARAATFDEIKKAFTNLAPTTHPDRNPEAPMEDFVEMRYAYQTLIDPQKRARYDLRYERTPGANGSGGSGVRQEERSSDCCQFSSFSVDQCGVYHWARNDDGSAWTVNRNSRESIEKEEEIRRRVAEEREREAEKREREAEEREWERAWQEEEKGRKAKPREWPRTPKEEEKEREEHEREWKREKEEGRRWPAEKGERKAAEKKRKRETDEPEREQTQKEKLPDAKKRKREADKKELEKQAKLDDWQSYMRDHLAARSTIWTPKRAQPKAGGTGRAKAKTKAAQSPDVEFTTATIWMRARERQKRGMALFGRAEALEGRQRNEPEPPWR